MPSDVRPEALRETIRQGHVKLVSDGTYGGTRLLMPDGTPIPGIRAIRWTADEPGRARLEVDFGTHEVEIGGA